MEVVKNEYFINVFYDDGMQTIGDSQRLRGQTRTVDGFADISSLKKG